MLTSNLRCCRARRDLNLKVKVTNMNMTHDSTLEARGKRKSNWQNWGLKVKDENNDWWLSDCLLDSDSIVDIDRSKSFALIINYWYSILYVLILILSLCLCLNYSVFCILLISQQPVCSRGETKVRQAKPRQDKQG